VPAGHGVPPGRLAAATPGPESLPRLRRRRAAPAAARVAAGGRPAPGHWQLGNFKFKFKVNSVPRTVAAVTGHGPEAGPGPRGRPAGPGPWLRVSDSCGRKNSHFPAIGSDGCPPRLLLAACWRAVRRCLRRIPWRCNSCQALARDSPLVTPSRRAKKSPQSLNSLSFCESAEQCCALYRRTSANWIEHSADKPQTAFIFLIPFRSPCDRCIRSNAKHSESCLRFLSKPKPHC
jgi:hypothetical protein